VTSKLTKLQRFRDGRTYKTLREFIIENQNAFQYSSGELSRIINSIRLAAKVVNYKVNKAGLVDIVGAAGEQNQGEDQQNHVYANEVFYSNAN
jgi:fructose-1,6-bisphosphatase I